MATDDDTTAGDGILTSGREHLTLRDRVTMLGNDRLLLQARQLRYQVKLYDLGPATAMAQRMLHDNAHESGCLTMILDGLVTLAARAKDLDAYAADFEARYRRPFTSELSMVECRVLAFNRGGAAGVKAWQQRRVSVIPSNYPAR